MLTTTTRKEKLGIDTKGPQFRFGYWTRLVFMWVLTVHTKIRIEPSVGGQIVLLVEAEVPLAHSMCGVSNLPQLICNGGTVKR